jgi:branched-subunit amino acid ABC-type transport system permease component
VLSLLPFTLSGYNQVLASKVALYFIAILGLNIVTGYAGQISIGHGAFMAIGGYTTAILSHDHGTNLIATLPLSFLVAFGFGDYAAAMATRRAGFAWTALAMQVIGNAALVLVLLVMSRWPAFEWSQVPWAFALALIGTVSLVFLYRAFALGPIAVVSPVVAKGIRPGGAREALYGRRCARQTSARAGVAEAPERVEHEGARVLREHRARGVHGAAVHRGRPAVARRIGGYRQRHA